MNSELFNSAHGMDSYPIFILISIMLCGPRTIQHTPTKPWTEYRFFHFFLIFSTDSPLLHASAPQILYKQCSQSPARDLRNAESKLLNCHFFAVPILSLQGLVLSESMALCSCVCVKHGNVTCHHECSELLQIRHLDRSDSLTNGKIKLAQAACLWCFLLTAWL